MTLVNEPEQSAHAAPRRRRRKFALGCLLPLFLIISVPFAVYKFAEHRLKMDAVPADLEVQSLLYEKQENWGSALLPLPGDNETGLLLYKIPAAVADRIAAEGVSFFDRPENRGRRHGRQTDHASWRETPVPITWSFKGPSIGAYLERYGFGIEIEPSIVAMIARKAGKFLRVRTRGQCRHRHSGAAARGLRLRGIAPRCDYGSRLQMGKRIIASNPEAVVSARRFLAAVERCPG